MKNNEIDPASLKVRGSVSYPYILVKAEGNNHDHNRLALTLHMLWKYVDSAKEGALPVVVDTGSEKVSIGLKCGNDLDSLELLWGGTKFSIVESASKVIPIGSLKELFEYVANKCTALN